MTKPKEILLIIKYPLLKTNRHQPMINIIKMRIGLRGIKKFDRVAIISTTANPIIGTKTSWTGSS